MRKLPTLLPLDGKKPDGTDSVVLAVYAPFGSDKVLSAFPDGTRKSVGQQPLVSELRKVAKVGVHVSALIDLFDDFSYLVEIPAGLPGQMRVHSTWKQNMSSPYALEGFLRHTRQRHPCAALVLAMEGHGAGFLPDLDTAQITPLTTSNDGQVNWQLDPRNDQRDQRRAAVAGFWLSGIAGASRRICLMCRCRCPPGHSAPPCNAPTRSRACTSPR